MSSISSVSSSDNVSLGENHEIEIALLVCGFWPLLHAVSCFFAKISCGFAGSVTLLTPQPITVLGYDVLLLLMAVLGHDVSHHTMAALEHDVNSLWPFSDMTSYYGRSRT